MKKYLISGEDAFYGPFGGVRALIVNAKNTKDAKIKALKKHPNLKKIVCKETHLNKPPTHPWT